MKEKGGHFIPSLGLALAAHALLFLLFFWFVSRLPDVPKVAPVEIQFAGNGGGGLPGDGGPPGGGPGSGGTPAAGRAAPRALKSARPAPPAPVSPAAPAAAPAPAPLAQPQRAAEPPAAATAGPAETPGGGPGNGGAGGGGDGGGGGAGSGAGDGSGAGGEAAGDWAALPPATLADIDPVPIREISASYPPSARLLGQQGLVRVLVEVDRDGTVTGERIAKSSGFRLLDNAAMDAVRSARFMPAMKNGKTVAAMVIIPVRFKLTQD